MNSEIIKMNNECPSQKINCYSPSDNFLRYAYDASVYFFKTKFPNLAGEVKFSEDKAKIIKRALEERMHGGLAEICRHNFEETNGKEIQVADEKRFLESLSRNLEQGLPVINVEEFLKEWHLDFTDYVRNHNPTRNPFYILTARDNLCYVQMTAEEIENERVL